MVKIKKAKDLNGESFYFASHAQATFMDDGSTVQDQIEMLKDNQNTSLSPNLSNYVTTDQLNTALSSVQPLIEDLDVIRQGAEAGQKAIKPNQLSGVAFSNNYADLGNVPHIPTSVDIENWGFVNQDSVAELLDSKVDAVDGKVLSSNDFTDVLKTKLENLTNYDDSEIQLAVETLQESFDTLVNGDTTTAIKSFNEIISFLDGIQDSQDLSSIIANIQQQITGKADKSSLSTVATSGNYNDLTNKPTIPSAVTESTVSGWGFTKNAGTVTGVKINGSTKNPSSGVVDLGTVITAHQTLKTINGQSIVGSGDVVIGGGNVQAVDTGETLDDVSGVTYVKYTVQTLTDEQKAQARANIGAEDALKLKINGRHITPENGIVDLNVVETTMISVDGDEFYGAVIPGIILDGNTGVVYALPNTLGDVLPESVADDELVTKSYVDGLVGDINSVLESIINGGNAVDSIYPINLSLGDNGEYGVEIYNYFANLFGWNATTGTVNVSTYTFNTDEDVILNGYTMTTVKAEITTMLNNILNIRFEPIPEGYGGVLLTSLGNLSMPSAPTYPQN